MKRLEMKSCVATNKQGRSCSLLQGSKKKLSTKAKNENMQVWLLLTAPLRSKMQSLSFLQVVQPNTLQQLLHHAGLALGNRACSCQNAENYEVAVEGK